MGMPPASAGVSLIERGCSVRIRCILYTMGLISMENRVLLQEDRRTKIAKRRVG